MSRSLVRSTVYDSLLRRNVKLEHIHRGMRIATLIVSPEQRSELAEELTASTVFRGGVTASQLDYLRVGDLLTIVYNALPGKSTTKPGGGD